MKISILLLGLIFLCSLPAASQINGITDKGDEVILYDNGTWKYAKEFLNEDSTIHFNPTPFTAGDSATFLLKSDRTHLGFWLNPKKWNFSKAIHNASAEYELNQRVGDLQALIITETIPLTLETLRKIVINNAKNASPDYHVISQEYRKVNGLKVLYLESEGTISEISFSFYGYYYSDASTTLQFLVLAPKNSASDQKQLAEELLNGLVTNEVSGIGIVGKKKSPDYLKDQQKKQTGLKGCQRYFVGNWYYTYLTRKVRVERTLQKTTEYMGKYFYEFETRWTGDCSYQMTFLDTDDPDYKKSGPLAPVIVSISQIDENTMNYEASYNGKITKGEMLRDKVAPPGIVPN